MINDPHLFPFFVAGFRQSDTPHLPRRFIHIADRRTSVGTIKRSTKYISTEQGRFFQILYKYRRHFHAPLAQQEDWFKSYQFGGSWALPPRIASATGHRPTANQADARVNAVRENPQRQWHATRCNRALKSAEW
jgi:hypothetical protein